MDPEKKKTIVVGTLFVAMLGIGAFQFTKGGGETPPPADGKKDAAGTEGKEGDGKDGKPGDGKAVPAKNPMFASALGARDPFQPAAFSVSGPTPAAPVKPASTPTIPPRLGGGFVPTLPNAAPPGLSGELTPMPAGGGGTMPLPPVALPKPTFRGALIGVVLGARSAAVFRFGGSERIVPVGGEIEPGVRLVSLRSRRAVIDFHGERLTLDLRDEAPVDTARPADTPKAPASLVPTLPTPVAAPTLPDTGSEINND